MASGVSSTYLSVRRVEFDYAATTEDELTVQEDQLVWIIEDDDPEWHKVKIKSADSLAAPQIGLVPASYLTSAPIIRLVRAMYDYAPTLDDQGVPENDEEMAIAEGEQLQMIEEEADWCLVVRGDRQGAGFVPTNYLEDADAPHDQAAGEEPEEAYEEPAPVASIYASSVPPPPMRAATSATNVKTWSVTEIDKKKKKKKGTLGVGNGALFFASESDKTPVQQYPLSTLEDITTEKFKHLHLSFPSASEPLHFVIGNKEAFEEIVEKIESDRSSSGAAATSASPASAPTAPPPPPVAPAAPAPPPVAAAAYVPPPPPIRSASTNPLPTASSPPTDTPARNGITSTRSSGANAVALYDFEPQGDDEVAIVEGERVVLIHDGSTADDPDWAKIRKVDSGVEGVVPASYIELDDGASPVGASAAATNGHAAASAAAEDVPEDEDNEEEERRQEEERAAAVAVTAQLRADKKAQLARDRQLEVESKTSRREAEKERARQSRIQSQPRASPIPVPTSKGGLTQLNSDDETEPVKKSRSSRDGRSSRDASGGKVVRKPEPARVRTWKDRTGQFKVEAEFLGLKDNKIRLHKLNGVIIEVPLEKMSSEDTAWLKRHMSGGGDDDRRQRSSRSRDASSSRPASSSKQTSSSSQQQQQPKKQNTTDWFEFFLNAGCDIDACQRYARNAENEGLEDSLIPELEESNLRSLGLKEGDIIRVRKYLKEKYGGPPPPTPGKSEREEQIAADARMALAMQNGQPAPPAPNLFSGPDGKLRRGRRNTVSNNRTASGAVDSNALVAAGNEIAKTRGSTPGHANTPISAQSTGAASSSVDPMKQSSSTMPQVAGFDDDAWEVKPSSKPSTPAPAAAAPPPAAPAPPPAPTPAPAPAAAASLLAPESTAQAPARTGSAAGLTYNDGLLAQLGIGSNVQRPSSTPATSSAPSIPAFNPSAPRGPVTPIAANQGLLAPLIPTRTGFNASPMMPMATGYNAMQPQFTGMPPSVAPMMMSQPTGFVGMNVVSPPPMTMQPTGMNFQPQPTGFMQPQPTGFMQPQPTGFNPQASSVFAQPPPQQFIGTAGPPPQQPIQFNPMPPSSNSSSSTQSKTAQFDPNNVFASMKDGTFASGSTSLGPQQSNKYDALRPQPTGFGQMQPQPTGYGVIQPQPTGYGVMQPQMTGYNPMFGQQPPQQGYGGYR